MDIDRLTDGLRRALSAHGEWTGYSLEPLQDTGLAHAHIALGDSGLLARIPKQSQMDLSPVEHLAYEAACFERAMPSGATPAIRGKLPVSEALPRGALIVDRIDGRPAVLPHDLPAIMDTLAALHTQPVADQPDQPPLMNANDPLMAMWHEVKAQARFVDTETCDSEVVTLIRQQLHRFEALLKYSDRPPATLITFDAHPGNFLITDDGKAWMVDLEKSRYSYPGFDLAHATLYTSTTWDPQTHAILEPGDVARAYRHWNQQASHLADTTASWHVPLRRAMWLWSITWCAKWRALSIQEVRASGENWSADNNAGELNAHVSERVSHYLSVPIISRVTHEFHTLEKER